jgi:CHAD domain-containing protein
MKQKKIKAILQKKMKTIEKLSSSVGDSFDKNTIHDFRLSVKSLRSFLHLLESYAGHIKFRVPKKLKRLYDIAGTIRESELEKEFLNKMQLNTPRYVVFLDNTVARKKSEWKEHYKRKVILRTSKKIGAHKYKPLNAEELIGFFNKNLMSLAALKGHGTDSQLHEVRKNVKDIVHVAKIIDRKLWISANLPCESTQNILQELAQFMGNYNDERLILEHLSAFPLGVLTDEEKADMKQFRNAEKKKLVLEKKRLLEAAHLVEQGINSISFNPDALLKGIENTCRAEEKRKTFM